MAGTDQFHTRQLHPAEVTQGLARPIGAMAGHAGCIEVGGSRPVTAKALALPLPAAQGVVHVAKHHQRHRPLAADLLDCQGQVKVTPVTGGGLPVAAAGGAGVAAEPGGATVGHQHQGPVGWSGGGGDSDPISRLLQAHRSEGCLGRPGQVETTTGGAGPATHHGKFGLVEATQGPTAVQFPQQVNLTLKGAAGVVFAGVVVTQNAGHGQGQLAQQGWDALLAVAEVTHHEQGIGLQQLQQGMVAVVPGPMQVTGNGDAERFHPAGYRHLRCLGSCHPASAGGLLLVFASQTRSSADLVRTITELKRQRNAVILAHYYQEDAIQDIADFIGDSLELARKAAATSADVIVFCGVHFMAETAKILNPAKRVLLPDLEAGCSLADACPADAFASFRAEHPDHIVVSYINCSAAVKAQSDLICTSSNAVDLVRQLPQDRPILFAPDQNLGRWVQAQSGRELTLWPGSCQVHVAFSEQALLQLKLEQPRAEVLAHPECQQHLLDLADFIGSTSGLLRRAETSTAQSFIVLTEPGILHQMRLKVPNKEFFEVPGADGCSCNACPYMRLNTLEKLWQCLERMEPEISMDEELRLKALAPIERMLAMSR